VAKVIGGNGVLDEKTFRFNDYQLPKDQHGLFGKPSIHVRYDPHEETIGMQDEQAFDSAAMMRDIDAYITMFRLGRPRNAGVQEM
jgi:hypothetical protein